MNSELKALLRRIISKRECQEESVQKAREKFYTCFKRTHSKVDFLKKIDDFLRQCSTINSYNGEKIDLFRTELDCAVSTCLDKITFNFCSQEFYSLVPVKEQNVILKQKKKKKCKVESFVEDVQNMILKKKIQDLKQSIGFYKMKYEMIEYRIQKFVSTCLINQILEKKIFQNKNSLFQISKVKNKNEKKDTPKKKQTLDESCDYLLSSIKKRENVSELESLPRHSNFNKTTFLTLSQEHSILNSNIDENNPDLSYNYINFDEKNNLKKLVENMRLNLIQTKQSERNYKRKYERLKKVEEENLEKMTMLERELNKTRELSYINQTLAKELNILKTQLKSMHNLEDNSHNFFKAQVELKKAKNEIENLKKQLNNSDLLIKDLNEINKKNEAELQRRNMKDQNSNQSLFNGRSSGISHIYHRSHESSEYNNQSGIVEQLKEALTDLQMKITEYENKVTELNESLENYDNEINIKDDHIIILQNELSLAKKEIGYLGSIKQMNELAQGNIKQLENEILILKENGQKVQELMRKIDQKDREIKNLKKTIESVKIQSKREINTELVHVKQELKEVKKVVSGDTELVTLYELSQREIKDMDNELRNAWRMLKCSNKTYKYENEKIDKENQRLRKVLEVNKKEITMLKLKVSSLQRQNSMLSKEIEKPRINSSEVIELIEKVSSTKSQAKIKDFTSESTTEFLSEINRLNSKISTLETINKNLQIDIENNQKEITELYLYKDKFKGLEELIFKERAEQEREVLVLRQRLNHLQNEIDNKQNAIEKLEETNQKLEKEISTPESVKLDEKKKQLSSVRRSMKFEEPEDEYLNDSDKKRRPVGQMNVQKLELDEETTFKALKDELDYMTRLKDKFANKLHEARKELTFAVQDKEDVLQSIKGIEKQILDISKENEQIKEEKLEYIKTCDELMQKLASIHSEKINLKSQLSKLENVNLEFENLKNELSQTKHQVEVYKGNYEKLLENRNLEHDEGKNKVIELSNTIAKLNGEYLKEKERREDLKRDFDNIVARCEELGERCFAGMNEINEKQAEIEELTLMIEKLENEEKKMVDEKIQLIEESNQLKKENKKLKQLLNPKKVNVFKNEIESKTSNNILIEENKYIGDSEIFNSHIRLESINNSSNTDFGRYHLQPKDSDTPKRNLKKKSPTRSELEHEREKLVKLQEEIIRSSLGINQVSAFDSQEKDAGAFSKDFNNIHLLSDNSLVEIIIRDSAKKYFLEHLEEDYNIILRDRSLLETHIRGMCFEVNLKKYVNQALVVSENFKEEIPEKITEEKKLSPGKLIHSSFGAYNDNDLKNNILIQERTSGKKPNIGRRKESPLSIGKLNPLVREQENSYEEEFGYEFHKKYQSKQSNLSIPTEGNSNFNSTLKGSVIESEDMVSKRTEETPCISKLNDSVLEEPTEKEDKVSTFKKKDHVKYLIKDRVEEDEEAENDNLFREKMFKTLSDLKHMELESPRTSARDRADEEMERKKRVIQSGLLDTNNHNSDSNKENISNFATNSNKNEFSSNKNYQSFGNFPKENSSEEVLTREVPISEKIRNNLIAIKRDHPVVFKSQGMDSNKKKDSSLGNKMNIQPAQVDKTKKVTVSVENLPTQRPMNIFHAIQIDSKDKLSKSYHIKNLNGSDFSNGSDAKFMPRKATLCSSKYETGSQENTIQNQYVKNNVQNSGNLYPTSNKFRKYSNSPKSFNNQTTYQRIMAKSYASNLSGENYKPQKVKKAPKFQSNNGSFENNQPKNIRVYEISPQRIPTKITPAPPRRSSPMDNYELVRSFDLKNNSFNFKKKEDDNKNKVVISSKISIKSKNSGDLSKSSYSNILKQAVFSGESKLDLTTLRSSRSKSTHPDPKSMYKSLIQNSNLPNKIETLINTNKSIEFNKNMSENTYDNLNLFNGSQGNLINIVENKKHGQRSLSLKNRNKLQKRVFSGTENSPSEQMTCITSNSENVNYTNLYPSQEYGGSFNNNQTLGLKNYNSVQFRKNTQEDGSRTRRSPYEPERIMKENDSNLTNKKSNKLTLRYEENSTNQKERYKKNNVLFDSEFVKNKSNGRNREMEGGNLKKRIIGGNRVLNVRPNFDTMNF